MIKRLIGGPADGKEIPDHIPTQLGGHVAIWPCDVAGVVYIYRAGHDGEFRYERTNKIPDRWNWTRMLNED